MEKLPCVVQWTTVLPERCRISTRDGLVEEVSPRLVSSKAHLGLDGAPLREESIRMKHAN